MHRTVITACLTLNLYLEVQCAGSTSTWHAIVSDAEYDPDTRAFPSTDTGKHFRDSWGSPFGPAAVTESSALHVDEALDLIFKHQHPRNCSEVRYLLSAGNKNGFGAELHWEGLGLALALETGRVYVPLGTRASDSSWRDAPECTATKRRGIDCYYEAWSNCTRDQRRLAVEWPLARFGGHSGVNKTKYVDYFARTSRLPSEILKAFDDEPGDIVLHPLSAGIFARLVPRQLISLARQAMRGLREQDRPPHSVAEYTAAEDFRYHYHYYFRAISTAYLMRLRPKTSNIISEFGIPTLAHNPPHCIACYVRHGDKQREMKLVEVEAYGEAILKLHKQGKGQLDRVAVVGTETPLTLLELIAWGRRNDFSVVFNHLSLELFQIRGLNLSQSDTLSNTSAMTVTAADREKYAVNLHFNAWHPHIYEYTSILVNLRDFLRCQAFVCTLASTFCRVLDELRAMLGGGSTPFADLSRETCSAPPCMGWQNITSFLPNV